MTRSESISQKVSEVVLTPLELEAAIWEGKVKKYFEEKNAPYWEAAEKVKPQKSRANVVK